MYWTINNMFSVTQTVGLRTSAMKKVFGIPDMPTVQPAFKPKNPMNPIKAFIDVCFIMCVLCYSIFVL